MEYDSAIKKNEILKEQISCFKIANTQSIIHIYTYTHILTVYGKLAHQEVKILYSMHLYSQMKVVLPMGLINIPLQYASRFSTFSYTYYVITHLKIRKLR